MQSNLYNNQGQWFHLVTFVFCSSSPTDVVLNESFVSSLMLAYISLQRELQQVYVEQSAHGKRNHEILGSLEGMKVELVTAKEQLEAAEEERIQQVHTTGNWGGN